MQTSGPVGRAHQRTAHHPGESDAACLFGELDEFFGAHPAFDGMVLGRGSEVLRDREQVAARRVEVAHGGDHFVDFLAHAQDQVGLGDHPGGAGLSQDVQGPVIAEGRADALEQPGHGFEVVREHLGRSVEDLAEEVGVRGEVGDENFDTAAGYGLVDGPHGLGVEPGALVGKVVAGDPGDRGVGQAHRGHGLGHPTGLVAVEGFGLAGVDLAEVTSTGAL
ncbi:unannotated protein [freshwater metagenome]|uniref:Unannotated protein n=1 Tax=freshwater metagenome TaxID=449393 RepID=A0A6J7LA78_9ZZZZ